MTRFIQSLRDVLGQFDVAVLDQWGVMHDGSTPYPHAAGAVEMLAAANKQICVVSNSGKRSDLNRDRIRRMGLPAEHFSQVVTSGEALWEDLAQKRLNIRGRVPGRLYPICAVPSDAYAWASGNDDIEISESLDESVDAILLMGLADGTEAHALDHILSLAMEQRMPLICSNPDKKAPRATGLVISPGTLADRYATMGGDVIWYGKPNANIYSAVKRRFVGVADDRFLMVGDSLEHDIAGAQAAGFQSALVRGGLHADDFARASDPSSISGVCDRLVAQFGIRPPDFCIEFLG